jgi:hypothetical protein
MFFRAVNSSDDGELKRLVPESYFRLGILTAFSAMQPARRAGVVVNIEDYRGQKLLDGATARSRIQHLLVRPQASPATSPSYITGALVEMKFQERRLRLQLVGTGRALDASYGDDFEPVLLDHPRELIQVHGNVVYGEDGSATSISDVDEILDVDESAIEVRAIVLDGMTLQARQPISFTVTFDKETQLYEATGPFGMAIGAQTRPDLEAQLDAEFGMLWREYALAKSADLTSAAIGLKQELLDALAGSADAT